MNTTLQEKSGGQADQQKPAQEKSPGSEVSLTSQNDLNLIREILVRPSEELNEGRIVELVRMIEDHEEAFNKRISRLESNLKKLATTVDNNQLHAVSDIGNAMVAAGHRIMDLQEKLEPAVPTNKP